MSAMAISSRIERIDAAPPPATLITLPIVLISLLKFTQFGVRVNKARDGSTTWYFRFSPKAILQVHEDGAWSWTKGPEMWRRRIEPILARAEAMLAEPAYNNALPGAGNVDSSRPTRTSLPERQP
jgi:hypothetical protein